MADLNLQEIHDFMISIAKKAGERIVSAEPTTDTAGSKKNCKHHHHLNTPTTIAC
jgi:myo-inositol-1(or 4)-monophosphatase